MTAFRWRLAIACLLFLTGCATVYDAGYPPDRYGSQAGGVGQD